MGKGGLQLPGASGFGKHCLNICWLVLFTLNSNPRSLVLGIFFLPWLRSEQLLPSFLDSVQPPGPLLQVCFAASPRWACPLRPQLEDTQPGAPTICPQPAWFPPCPAPGEAVAWNWPFAILFSAHLFATPQHSPSVLPVT